MGQWIDDLAVEQIDTDGDGSLETTLYPITDLLGSVQLLTDDGGQIVERITYDPDGTPHFWSADTTRPNVTRLAWTGDGSLPTGDTVTPQAFEIGFSEPIDPASAAAATATLTPDGGIGQTLTLTLAADSRTAYLTGATVAAGTTYTLHVDGLTDTTHNPIWPEDATVTVADAGTYEVLDDTTAPQLLAVLDGSDALYLLFDELIQPAAGYDLGTSLSIVRQGQPVEGAATRITSQLLEWQPGGGAGGLIPGGTYTISGVHLTDLSGNAATAGATFTHLNTSDQMLLLAYAAPTDTHPESTSAYGLTTLFQGRTWHPDLGMYYYRNRWYLPEAGAFAERDPLGYGQSPSLYPWLRIDPTNAVDPRGKIGAFDSFNEQPENREQQRKFFSGQIPTSPEERAFAKLLGAGIVLPVVAPAVVYVLPEAALLSGTTAGAVSLVSATANVWRSTEPIDEKVDRVLVDTARDFVIGTVPAFATGRAFKVAAAGVAAATPRIYVLLKKRSRGRPGEEGAQTAWSALVAIVTTAAVENSEGTPFQKALRLGALQVTGELLMAASPATGPYDPNVATRRTELMRSCHLGDGRVLGSCTWSGQALYAIVVLGVERPGLLPSH